MAYIDKRWVGVFNYRFRRKFQHDLGMLEKGVDYIIEKQPDLAVCTGDLTSTGQPGEFRQTLAILERLRNSQIPLIYVVGNHDYYVYRRNCVEAMKEAFRYLNTAFELEFDELPVKRSFRGLEIFVVNESWPSNLISSHGLLKKESDKFLCSECARQKTEARLMISHYPLLEDHPLLRIRHRLFGGKNITKLLKDRVIDLSLCGHMHLPYAKIDESGRGEICAGSITRNRCLAEIDYDEKNSRFIHKKVIL